jgi:acyl carrier protein
MTQAEVVQKLQPIFDTVFTEEVTVRPDLTARHVAEWDSLSHVSLVLAIEHEFGIRFRVGEVELTRNVGELIDLISRRAAKG